MRLSHGLIVGVAVALGAEIAGCGGGNSPAIVGIVPSPTPPAIPVTASTTSFQSIALSAPASGGTQIPVAVPTVAGYAGSIGLPVPANLPANANLAETVSNTPIDASTVPTLQSALRAVQSTRSTASTSLAGLLFFKLASSATLTFPNLPAITLTVPATSILAGTSYYLAAFDPLRTSLSWQKGWEGPATISGTTLTFASPNPAVPFTLSAQVPLYLALYAVNASVTAPTPAPSVSPAATPTPIPAFTLSSTSLSLLSVGATGTTTITDPSGYTGAYATASSATSVATAQVSGSTITVTAVAVGSATVTVADSQGRTATIAVQITTTNLPLQ